MDRIAALTFDLDGTLADVARRRLRMWPGMLAHPRVMSAYPAAFSSLRGRRVRDAQAEVARLVAEQLGARVDRVRDVLDKEIEGRWPTLFDGAPVLPVASALLAAADQLGLPRAVVSDYPALDKLAAMGLVGWSAVIDCRSLGALKPLPDGLHAAAAQLGVPVGALLHVGDRWDTDGSAAAAAGCSFLHIEAPLDEQGWRVARVASTMLAC